MRLCLSTRSVRQSACYRIFPFKLSDIPFIPKPMLDRLKANRGLKFCCFIGVLSVLLILPASAQTDSLIPAAVMQFSGKGIDSLSANVLTDRFGAELFRTGRFKLIERTMMSSILTEQGFQQTGCVDDACAVKIGQIIGVKEVIAGSVSKLDKTWTISVRRIKVETGEIAGVAAIDCPGSIDNVLSDAMRQAAEKLVTAPVVAVAPVAVQMQPVTTPPTACFQYSPIQLSLIWPLQIIPRKATIGGLSIDAIFATNQNVYGIYAGAINHAHDKMIGISAGVVNVSGKCYGFQVGLINVCDDLKGFQIGLINVERERRVAPVVPLINLSF